MSSNSRSRLRRGVWTSLAAALSLAHCVDGGLNENEQTAGNGDNGVDVGFGEIAIDPSGSYLISRADDALVYGDLATAQVHTLRGLGEVQRVAFANKRRDLFATKQDFESAVGRIYRYDLVKDQVVWSRAVGVELDWDNSGWGTKPWLEVLDDDSKLILTFDEHVEVVDSATGKVVFKTARGRNIIDLDVTPDQKRMLVTYEHSWEGDVPRTELESYDLSSFAKVSFSVPNCADEVVVAPDGGHAFLAPTECINPDDLPADPISVINLSTHESVRNLPGFGPVAIAPDGQLAIGFLDMNAIDESLFDDKTQIPGEDAAQYHVMLIDTKTLKFELVELGDTLPRYAVSPDGKLLLIDADAWLEDGRIRLLDVKTRTIAPVKGPDLRLEHYAVTRDSQRVFLLDQGLFQIELAKRTARAELIDFTPQNLNITPDDKLLVLREDSDTLRLYDVAKSELVRTLELD
jgi:DNA-binding beta-propeller fold protein YncE